MNAYELAEWLEANAIELPANWETGEPINNMTISATMLRQQAKRIEELEKDIHTLENAIDILVKVSRGEE